MRGRRFLRARDAVIRYRCSRFPIMAGRSWRLIAGARAFTGSCARVGCAFADGFAPSASNARDGVLDVCGANVRALRESSAIGLIFVSSKYRASLSLHPRTGSNLGVYERRARPFTEYDDCWPQLLHFWLMVGGRLTSPVPPLSPSSNHA